MPLRDGICGHNIESRAKLGPLDGVFESKRVRPVSVRTIQSQISELGRRAGIKRIRVSPHALRHTFALGHLRQKPGKLVELENLLGHESPDTQPSADEFAEDMERSQLNVYP